MSAPNMADSGITNNKKGRKKMSTTALTTIEPNELKKLMAEAGVSMDDIKIARLNLIQNTSKQAQESTAKAGDLLNNQTLEVVADYTKKVELVPLKMYEVFLVFDESVSPAKLVRIDPIENKEDKKKPWNFVEDGKKHRRDRSYNFYFLEVSKLGDPVVFPVVLGFKRTSQKTGEQIANFMVSNLMMKGVAYNRSLVINIVREQKATNYYAVMSMAPGRVLTTEEQAVAGYWFNTINSRAHEVAQEIVEETNAPEPIQIAASEEMF